MGGGSVSHGQWKWNTPAATNANYTCHDVARLDLAATTRTQSNVYGKLKLTCLLQHETHRPTLILHQPPLRNIHFLVWASLSDRLYTIADIQRCSVRGKPGKVPGCSKDETCKLTQRNAMQINSNLLSSSF